MANNHPPLIRSRRRSTVVLLVLAMSIALVAFQQVFIFMVPATVADNDNPWIAHQKIADPATPLSVLQQNVPLREDNNSTFSACLLIMDDNHYLMEWLAYHYHTLPLRYLVVAVDPRSRTSPNLVLDRWERNMTIVRWTDQHFVPKEWINRIPEEDDPIAKLIKHRERQRNFYPTCFEFLKQAGREWTMVIDSDEFATQNQHYDNFTRQYPTLLESIQAQAPYNHHNTTCITMPRLRFGNYEDGNTTNKPLAPPGFDDENFLTLRWRWRAGLQSRKDNRNPKSMIQLQRIMSNFTRQETDAHRPVRSECPRRNLYILNQASPFSVHHYAGSVAQFNFRKDARNGMSQRSPEKLDGYAQVYDEIDESLCGWLKEFGEKYGYNQAKMWLEGVGNVSYSPTVHDH